MDLQDRILVVVLAGHHAAKLHPAEPGARLRNQLLDLGVDRLVLSFEPELEEDLGVLDPLRFDLELVDRRFDARPLALLLLRLLLVVPITGLGR
jgi:hypothetical protein